jgi:hypothetical protein
MSEETLPDAKRQLENATAALIDPRPTTHDGDVIWIDSIYKELRQAIHGHRAGSTRQPSEPQPPLWIDGLDLCRDIDDQVKRWERNPSGPEHHTVNRLRAIVTRSWRPQDTRRIEEIANSVAGFVRRYTELTDDDKRRIEKPCPRCEQEWSYRTLDGERIRERALLLTSEACHCRSCGARWTSKEFTFLARLLGCPTPEGVVSP